MPFRENQSILEIMLEGIQRQAAEAAQDCHCNRRRVAGNIANDVERVANKTSSLFELLKEIHKTAVEAAEPGMIRLHHRQQLAAKIARLTEQALVVVR